MHAPEPDVSADRPPGTIVICGSKTNDVRIAEIGAVLTSEGFTVALPGPLPGESATTTRRAESKRHLDRIRDETTRAVLVVNTDRAGHPDYIGPHTFGEIGVAFAYSRPTFLLYGMPDCFAEELAAWDVICVNNDLTKLVKLLRD